MVELGWAAGGGEKRAASSERGGTKEGDVGNRALSELPAGDSATGRLGLRFRRR